MLRWAVCALSILVLSAAQPLAQVVGQGAERARPVTGDPGVSSMVVEDRPEYRALRDFCEPGATRRLHSHSNVTYHVFTLVTGRLRVTIEGQAPVEIGPGDILHLDGGAMHTFTNSGDTTATIVEVFGTPQEVQ